MSEGPRRGPDLGVAAVAMIGARGALVAIILERDEGTRGRAVDEGQAAFRHRGDDTRHMTALDMIAVHH
jgi:hypothetical protein